MSAESLVEWNGIPESCVSLNVVENSRLEWFQCKKKEKKQQKANKKSKNQETIIQ